MVEPAAAADLKCDADASEGFLVAGFLLRRNRPFAVSVRKFFPALTYVLDFFTSSEG